MTKTPVRSAPPKPNKEFVINKFEDEANVEAEIERKLQAVMKEKKMENIERAQIEKAEAWPAGADEDQPATTQPMLLHPTKLLRAHLLSTKEPTHLLSTMEPTHLLSTLLELMQQLPPLQLRLPEQHRLREMMLWSVNLKDPELPDLVEDLTDLKDHLQEAEDLGQEDLRVALQRRL